MLEVERKYQRPDSLRLLLQYSVFHDVYMRLQIYCTCVLKYDVPSELFPQIPISSHEIHVFLQMRGHTFHRLNRLVCCTQ